MKKIMVAGGGVLGSQIAFQAAYCGFDVTIWLRSEGSICITQPKLAHLKDVYTQTITRMDTPEGKVPQVWASGIADYTNFYMSACLAQTERAAASIRLELDLAKAAADADLVIESMAERAGDKIDFYKKLAPVLPEKTVLVTNSSSLLPSKFAKYTGRIGISRCTLQTPSGKTTRRRSWRSRRPVRPRLTPSWTLPVRSAWCRCRSTIP